MTGFGHFNRKYIAQQKLRVEQLRAEVRRRMAADEDDQTIATAVGISRRQVLRHRKVIMGQLQTENLDRVSQWREEHIETFEDLILEIRANCEPGKPMPLKAIDRLLHLLQLDMRLKGTAAPERSIQAHVEVNTTVQYQFLEHSHGLDPQQLQEVFRFMDSLPRRKVSIDLTGFNEPRILPAAELVDVVDEADIAALQEANNDQTS